MTVDYKLCITPLDETGRTYGTRVDVTKDVDISDFVAKGGVGRISRELDQGDYDIGVFNYNSLTLKLNNRSGIFNESRLDWRSMFPSIRDRAMIELDFIDRDSAATISYEGLLTDKATRQDLNEDSIRLVFLGLESIFQTSVVGGGTILSGMTFSQAFRAILDVPIITSVLTYTQANINPAIDLAIDSGSSFNGLSAKEALDRLLLASNSVLLIDSDRNIIIKSRDANANTPHELYANDAQGRDNILSSPTYNNGLQRMFNVVVIDGSVYKNTISTGIYSERSKSISLPFITTLSKRALIAATILDEFAFPMDEFTIEIKKHLATDWMILDKAKISIEPFLVAEPGRFAPIYGVDSYDRAAYPREIGGFRVNGNRVFKTTGVYEDPQTFNVSFRLRDTGVVL